MMPWMLLGVLLAWPCWLLLRRVRQALQPLRCVQPYRPVLQDTPPMNKDPACE